jgi:hypothetical protein
MPTLFARGSDGVVCIYTGSNDVVSSPTSDLSRVLFHSSLEYPAILTTTTLSVTLPARTSNTYQDATHTLFAHGRAGIPFVLGYISNMSNVALAGSVPVDMAGNGLGRWVDLGADTTNVILHEQSVVGNGLSMASRTLDLVIYVTDLILT